MTDLNPPFPPPLIPVIISQERTNQQQGVADLAMDGQDHMVEEIPELRRGCLIVTTRYLASDLPPLHRLEDIFADMASKALERGFSDVLCQLGKRPLRVATMCSGTEAPLLALDMISTGLGMDLQLRISHAFSCEIVPFKQSYIERNFRPPLLFRDIKELGGDVAQTAYGSPELIPGNLDVLVAGTACVDFSPLNNCKKTLQQDGESGATFDGLLRYAEKYRPRLIIQENVRTAPWAQMKDTWEGLDYMSVDLKVDTKHYYIPQTRERGYLVVIDKRRLEAAGVLADLKCQVDLQKVDQHVRDLVRFFKRQASAPVGMFLLSDDDRRLETIEKKACLESRSETGWQNYQSRHQRHRDELELGNERPITRSQPGVNLLKAPDFFWHRFIKTQPERVWETVDMNFLKKIVSGYDMNFKERWIDLSQGVDRGHDILAASGIAGCLTPKGIPFLTTRGGPVSGTEALSLQGLPLNRMLLTTESQADLMDMAGNAMTSTVVCAVILAGLIAAYKILDIDNGSTESTVPEDNPLLISNEYRLVRSSLGDTSTRPVNHHDLKALSASTVMCCSCERQTGVKDPIFTCTLCGHSACISCHGNPTHSYLRKSHCRLEPSEFIATIKELVPMKLTLSGFSELNFEAYKSFYLLKDLSKFWDGFMHTVKSLCTDVFQFFEVKRGRSWRVIYQGPHSSLYLEIGPDSIQWLLYGKPPQSASTRSYIREVLAKPIARMRPNNGSFIEGVWEMCSPVSTAFTVNITGTEQQVKSFEAECGLKGANFVNSQVWTHLYVDAPDADLANLDHNIRGFYEALPHCGTSLGAMYRRKGTDMQPAIYLFLDTQKLTLPKDDACVFSLGHSRLPGYEQRMSIAELSPTWRAMNTPQGPRKVTAYCRHWLKASDVKLNIHHEEITHYALPQGTQILITNAKCHDAYIPLASLSVPTMIQNLPDAKPEWQAWDPVVSMRELKELAWLFQKIAGWSNFKEWNKIGYSESLGNVHEVTANCDVCNPHQPSIIWGRDSQERIMPYESPQDAAIYERAIKSRPSPFTVFRRVNEQGDGELCFALNVQVLMHQVHGKLVGFKSRENIASHWRLLPHAYDMQKSELSQQDTDRKFTLLDNSNDTPSSQPPNFLFSLRNEQLKSLSWMISQEADDIVPFMEEEVEESILPLMPWRAEVKATVPKIIRGGVLADEVGYGKTAIVLGLIDAQYKQDCSRISDESEKLIPTKATLIIVPNNVFKQWHTETKKFLGEKYKVLALESITKTTIRDIQDADIVILSWSILANDSYYTRLQRFTGTPQAPTRSGRGTGRNFDSWFHDARASLRELVGTLRSEGPDALLKAIEAKRRKVQAEKADCTYVPSKRLKGKSFAAAQQKAAKDESNTAATAQTTGTEESLGPGKGLNPADSGYEDSDQSDSDDNDRDANASQRKRRPSTQKMKFLGGKRKKTQSTDPAVSDVKHSARSKVLPDDATAFGIRAGQGWRTVAAFIHTFDWNRLIIDEYTYAEEERQVSLLSVQARSKWVLSGTPELSEFADIKSIARYLGLELGIDDDGDSDRISQNKRLRMIRKNHTAAEAFQRYRAPRSNAWYRNREQHAQRFLDQFARQNIAQVDDIPLVTNIVLVDQTPEEKHAYDILYDAVTENRKRIDGPLNNHLIKSQSLPEALIMCCTTTRIGKPQWGIEKCRTTLETSVAKSAANWTKLDNLCRQVIVVGYNNHDNPFNFQVLTQFISKSKIGDAQVSNKFFELLFNYQQSYQEWIVLMEHQNIITKVNDRFEKALSATVAKGTRHRQSAEAEAETTADDESQEPSRKKVKTSTGASGEDHKQASLAMSKTLINDIINSLKSAIESDREIRFYNALLAIHASTIPTCNGCAENQQDIAKVGILRICGHALCKSCTQASLEDKRCVCLECDGKVTAVSKVIAGPSVLEEDRSSDSSKLRKLVKIFRSIPEEELVLIFVQIGHLMPIASNALKSADIEHRTIITNKDMKFIDEFIEGPKAKKGKAQFPRPKALILNLGSAMAAGLNLQCANHVVFLSPLFVASQPEYAAGMTQAIGRAQRYGQKRTVQVYHLVVRETVEVNIFARRNASNGNGTLVEREGVTCLVEEAALLPDDVKCSGKRVEDENGEVV
ncbi:hypothetical protein PENANT_c001G04633 [Penicillium antarcticum]|uniref:Helicase ATP-binding domain-containing protein n=1 Tax=Penicillium antarcticum TaxID=416450 RepID=A0A1V6QP16_9EURO|nr:hypothetical protein PENANT_c001G04633 [Penicillium antarcticum]